MANLKEIRIRITSVISTRQITSAMKMVSAAKLRRAQDAIMQMRPYATKLQEILTNLTESLETDDDNIFGKLRQENRILVVAITSNKGLCGGFNANVVKSVIQLADRTYPDARKMGNLDIMTVGKKGFELLKSKKIIVAESHNDIIDHPAFISVSIFTQQIMDSFVTGKYDKVLLVYNKFINAAVQELTVEQFLPIVVADKQSTNQPRTDFILEPSQKEIVQELIPKSLKIQFFKAFLDSVASEHGARMTAMHKATDNASDLIKQLQLEYNKARQASITKEILEIVGGAEALKS